MRTPLLLTSLLLGTIVIWCQQNRPTQAEQSLPASVTVIQTPGFAPNSIAELVSTSRLIVRGVFGPSLPPRLIGPERYGSTPVRDHILRIQEVLKGDIKPGAEILVIQSGGTWRQTEFRIANRLELTAGTEALMFLLPTTENEENRPRYYVNGLWAGAFLFQGDDVRVSSEVVPEILAASKQGKAAFLKQVRDTINKR